LVQRGITKSRREPQSASFRWADAEGVVGLLRRGDEDSFATWQRASALDPQPRIASLGFGFHAPQCAGRVHALLQSRVCSRRPDVAVTTGVAPKDAAAAACERMATDEATAALSFSVRFADPRGRTKSSRMRWFP
jgi:hypothetical protein